MIAIEAMPEIGSCPANEDLPCDIRGWVYRTESVYPRMYARCYRCGSWTIGLLPKREAYPTQPPDDEDSRVITAIERKLSARGVANRLPQLFTGKGIRLSVEMMDGVRDYLAEGVDKHLRLYRSMWQSSGAGYDKEVARQVEEKVGKLERRLYQIIGRMETLLGQMDDRIRKAIREERATIPPKPPAMDVLCDERHALPTIYGLISRAEPSRIRYVGQSLNAGSRYGSHCSKQAAPRVRDWVASLSESPLMILIENCHFAELTDRETHWIEHYTALGMADLNKESRPR